MRSGLRILVFELKGSLAHFRRPDTTVTHATYPFIPRTVLWGLLGSVLGVEQLTGENWIGIQLMSPVHTVAQEVSMLGKGWVGGGGSFNRPTSIELVVNPRYRVYYAGEHFNDLKDMIGNSCSHYHTYLGSAYCLTFPRYLETIEAEEITTPYPAQMSTRTVLPSHSVKQLDPQSGSQYGRVGGMQYQHLGNRTFSGTINLLYEVHGGLIKFEPVRTPSLDAPPYRFLHISGDEVICLW